TFILFIASTNLNLNRYQTPGELLTAFHGADARWRTFLGFAPPQIRGEMLMTILVVAATAVAIFFLAKRHPVAITATYFVVMSIFYAWCCMHPKHDAFSRALIAQPQHNGSARDTATLLRYEADYMLRTGRPDAARKALDEAAKLGQ
ncbi:MAG TPA: hypothetical protein VJZ00_17810, partial [Thermoanaerobaculia bacterium]|nr:hypothetical protein [Thermoanaerobaculia bacterium]